jgi:hypothetical protein
VPAGKTHIFQYLDEIAPPREGGKKRPFSGPVGKKFHSNSAVKSSVNHSLRTVARQGAWGRARGM